MVRSSNALFGLMDLKDMVGNEWWSEEWTERRRVETEWLEDTYEYLEQLAIGNALPMNWLQLSVEPLREGFEVYCVFGSIDSEFDWEEARGALRAENEWIDERAEYLEQLATDTVPDEPDPRSSTWSSW